MIHISSLKVHFLNLFLLIVLGCFINTSISAQGKIDSLNNKIDENPFEREKQFFEQRLYADGSITQFNVISRHVSNA